MACVSAGDAASGAHDAPHDDAAGNDAAYDAGPGCDAAHTVDVKPRSLVHDSPIKFSATTSQRTILARESESGVAAVCTTDVPSWDTDGGFPCTLDARSSSF